MKTLIIIPIYNESKVIKDIVKNLLDLGYENIVVVDDGSTDKTGDVIKKLPVIYIKHPINRGKGAAVKTGMEIAKELNAESIITMDGDGQHSSGDIKKMTESLKDGCDVALGSRSLSSKDMPLKKIIANYIGNFTTWVFYGLWVSDSQSGFRAYSKKAISLIETKSDRYEYDGEVLSEIKRHKLSFAEVPIKTVYTEYSQSKATKQGLKNGIKTVIRMVINN